MAKPRVQTRVDPSVDREIDAYADENDMSKAEAVRRLLSDGLEEQRAVTDGGEVVTRLDEIRAAQVRQERADALQTSALGVGLVFVGAAVGGVLSPLSVYVGGGVVLALLGAAEIVRRRAEAVELPRDEEVSADV